MATRRQLALWPLVLASLAAAWACVEIEDIEADQCGNAIIDSGEDCDTHARQGMPCYAPTAGAGKACRYDCSSSPCTGGLACGADQVCRAASGNFELSFTEPGSPRSLLVADFDGDGQRDICATAQHESSVHYLGPGLRVEQTTPLAIAVAARPTAGSLTLADPTDAAEIALLAGATRQDIGVLRGREDRSFAATAYPAVPIPVPNAVVFAMDAFVQLDGEEPMSLVRATDLDPTAPDVTVTLYVPVDGLSPGNTVVYGLAELADATVPALVDAAGHPRIDRVPVGQLDEDPSTSPCEEYVLAFRGESVVRIGTPCRGTEINGLPLADRGGPPIEEQLAELVRHIVVQLPAPVADAHVFDLDGNGHLDVLVTPSTEGASEPRAAWAVYGPFHFADAPAVPPPLQAQPYPMLELLPGERLLAIARIDDDEAPDFVTSRGVFLSRSADAPCPDEREGDPASASAGVGGSSASAGSGGAGTGGVGGQGGAAPEVHHCPAFAPAKDAGHFQDGVVGDFDDSGRLDVAMASNAAAELRVWMGREAGLVEHTIGTTDAPRHLAVGDFDGDGFDDIGFAEKAASSDDKQAADAVSVCFGQAAGPPEPPAGMGRLTDVIQVISSSLRVNDTPYADALDDLGIVARDEGSDVSLTFSVLQGSTDRLLQAPFQLFVSPSDDPDKTISYQTDAVTIGRFAPDPEDHGDMAALAVHRNDRGEPDRRLWLLRSFDEAAVSAALPGAPVDLPLEWTDGGELLATIDLDGDGTDEVVAIGLLSDTLGRPVGGAVLVAQAVASSEEGTVFDHRVFTTEDGLVIGRNPLAPSAPVVADVDADGRLDVVITGAKDIFAGDAKEYIVVLYNRWSADPSAQVGVLDALRIGDLVSYEAPAATGAFAVLQLDADAPLELLAFTGGGAFMLDAETGASPRPIPGLPSKVRTATAIDLDGDGLSELVLARDELEVWRSVPANP